MTEQDVKCDHTIGVNPAYGDIEFAKVSTLKTDVAFCRSYVHSAAKRKAVGGHGIPVNRDSDKKVLSALYVLFDYCPDCGAKLQVFNAEGQIETS